VTAIVRRVWRPGHDTVLSAAVVGLVAAGGWLAAWAMESASYDVVVGSLIGIVLGIASLFAGRSLARREPDPRVGRLLMAAPLLKLGMTVVRYGVAFVVYDGSADAAVYHNEGIRLQAAYAEGIFDADLGRQLVGTGFVRMLTGLLYTVTGPSLLGAFFVFSWLGFWGLYLFFRAFCIAVPDGDRLRYAALVLLLPSLLFWPSSLGKEAWMTFGLGLFAYGAARLLASLPRGFAVVAAGLLVTGMVRPHVAAMAAVGLFVAYLTRRRPSRATVTAPIGKLLGILALAVVLALAVGQSKDLLGIDSFNKDALDAARAEAAERTDEAGSAIEGTGTDFNPSQIHVALTSVLFRPFPWEARNLQGLIAAIEGTGLLLLMIVGWRRLASGIRSLIRTPYVVLSLVYTLLFVYGFSSFANFGILTRQRVQVLPFVLVFLALPPLPRRTGWRGALDVPTEAVHA
jgi:hypothetical protein